MRPVSGDLAKPFGVERDPATGVWIFRAAASFFARASEPVRSPAAGRVVRVGGSIAGGTGVVLAHDQGNWTTVVSGLASVAVAAGEKVSRGDPLGRAAPQPESTIRVETWRGRTPIDPTSVLGAR
jgi:murein DD-endopeptidase MepM/ murein hydrolase activator NlpD